MSDDNNNEHDDITPDQPEETAGPEEPTEAPAEVRADEPTETTERRPGFRDRLAGARGLIAVGAATLILGGVGGYAVGAVTSDGPGDRDHEHGRPFDDAGRGEFPRPGNPGGLPPTMPEDGAPAQPEGGSATNGSTT